MTDKEKIEEAKRLYQTANAERKYLLESLFPELFLSEDERIRKWLIGYFRQYKEDGIEKYANGLKVESIIAWLEKQSPKPKWTDEDDYNLQCMIAKAVNDIQNGNVGRNQELIDWLKSLKQRMEG